MVEELQIKRYIAGVGDETIVYYWRNNGLVNYGQGGTAEQALTQLTTRLASNLRVAVDRHGVVSQIEA